MMCRCLSNICRLLNKYGKIVDIGELGAHMIQLAGTFIISGSQMWEDATAKRNEGKQLIISNIDIIFNLSYAFRCNA